MDQTTWIFVGCAILALFIATLLVRRRRGAHRIEALPPLVFAVHDRREPRLRPAGFGMSGSAPRAYAPPEAVRTFEPPAAEPWPYAPSDGRTVEIPRGAMPSPNGYLPGRLEITGGPHRGEAIRFPRIDGDGVGDYTLGRGEGPPRTHIRLPVTTVSRQQARLRYEGGRWKLINLSQTNPTAVNGQVLHTPEGVRTLQDGDTVEMGELVLRFRSS
ncbi:MAG TPA: FHA domain-containing protein [Gemmatimonadaceae bacterium]|nr:FHA domain-containing protein [Gemmatimonadaceae bacterium]